MADARALLAALTEALADRPPTRDRVKRGSYCALTDEHHTLLKQARAFLTQPATPVGALPKPDGWHTYHICDGQLREVARVTDRVRSDTAHLTCAFCGDWVSVQASHLTAASEPAAGGEG